MALIKALIVDNHPSRREDIRSMLAGANNVEVVGEASNVAGAARWLARRDVDVVLMRMPNLDGLGAIGRIKAQHPATAVVVLGGNDDDVQVLDAVQAGASGYLLKDASPDLLLYTIRAACSGGTLIKTSILRETLAGLL